MTDPKIHSAAGDWLEVTALALAAGDLVVLPTARWYMFAAIGSDESAAIEIFRIKRRPPTKSLLLVAPSFDWIERHFVMSEAAKSLAGAFWPGDLAMRLPWSAGSSRIEAAGDPIGLVGLPADALGCAASRVGAPLVSTSVNISGLPKDGGTQPSIALSQVLEIVSSSSRVKHVIDGGVCPLVDALTVVECTAEEAFVWRPGTISETALSFVLPGLDLTRARSDKPPTASPA